MGVRWLTIPWAKLLRMKEVVPKCLEDSSWPKPLKLKEIYDQKKQARMVRW